MGASLALAGVTACTRQPAEKIVPYVRQPEELVPGKPLFYATAMPLGGVATGLLVESHEGRPTKIEGNPQHPGSLGATRRVRAGGDPRPLRSRPIADADATSARSGRGRRSSARSTPRSPRSSRSRAPASASSPNRSARRRSRAQIRDLLGALPAAKWHQWDPASRDNARAGSKLAFGEYVDAQYRFDQADVILSLDADFLGVRPGQPRATRATSRRAGVPKKPSG